MDEQTLPVELARVVWNGEAVPEHECTMDCLLPRHNCRDNSSASDVMLSNHYQEGHLFDQLDRGKKSALRIVIGQASLQVEGIGEAG